MAAGTEVSGETAVVGVAAAAVDAKNDATVAVSKNGGGDVNSGGNASDSSSINSSSKSDMQMHDFVDMLKKLKLNPLAKEFFPSTYPPRDQMVFSLVPRDQMGFNLVPVVNWDNNGFPPNNNHHRRRRNSYGQGQGHGFGHGNGHNQGQGQGQGRRRFNGRSLRAQKDDSIRRTVYVSDIDNNVTEEQLAGLFSGYGQVVDCRVCGDPHSRLRFAFVEFADEYYARAALNLGGTMLGFSPVKVLPSKTAILPVNPTFLPRSEDEREMCARTVYCTNIDKKVTQADVKVFFESRCGEVSRLRLLGDQIHSTRIAFVEFTMAESAILALDCCGEMLGSQHVRVSPSKTPVRPRLVRPMYHQ